MDKIKFIYFDVGGVLVRDFSGTNEWENVIKAWGVVEEKDGEMRKIFDEFKAEVCVGREVEEFLPILRNKFGVEIPQSYSILTDCADRFKKNEGIWEIVYDCQKKYGVGLLTDMYPGMLKAIMERELLPKINFLIIDSSIEKCKKPNEEIYKIAQERAGVKPEEILFIDNLEKNLVVPKSMGWQTFWFDSSNYERSNEELEKFLKN